MAVMGVATTRGLSPLHPFSLTWSLVRSGSATWGAARGEHTGLAFRKFGLWSHPCTLEPLHFWPSVSSSVK